ncbi:hypothetical protein [Phenylobacterium sp.]|uniref:hypothetical protein n=1 Tax=Phenylobacterium sp. TaxID=1871053 RepID=UPI003562626B
MTRLTRIAASLVLVGAAAVLASCGRPTDKARAPAASAGPIVERPGPVRWNAATSAFELNGAPLKTVKLWTFDGSTDGFTALGSKITPAPGSGIAVTIADPTIRSPKGLNVPGGQYPLVLVRLTRTAPAAVWDGALYYSTATHPETINFLGKPLYGANPKVGETTTLVYDMSRLAVGGPDWVQSTIDQIRFDVEDKPGGGFLIRQIAIAENPDPAALGAVAAPAAAPATPAPKS